MINLFVAADINDSNGKEYLNNYTDSHYIFPAKPHLTQANYFSGNQIIN